MNTLLRTNAPLLGMLRFAHYAFMPNRLGYCGGSENRLLFEYGIENVADGGLAQLVRQFNGAVPYLQLIARANGIAEPFDSRVVQAYWIGNDLLRRVEVRQLYEHLAERFKSQLQGKARELVLGKAPAGARPHHTFHVLDVYSRTAESPHSLAMLDNCRVSWGRVLSVAGGELVVERQPLVLHEGKLGLGPAVSERAVRAIDGRGFADAAAIGDCVSIHWGWVCEVFTESECAALAAWTRHHLAIANQTI